MESLKKLRKSQGFTIIEVMIVLAIAAVIMLIVFLAVPALQRNSRNTQRSNDAARIVGAVNECLANNNGVLTSCAADPAGANFGQYITLANNQQLIAGAAAPTVDAFDYRAGFKCNPTNQGTPDPAGQRAFVILYQVETSGANATRCVGS